MVIVCTGKVALNSDINPKSTLDGTRCETSFALESGRTIALDTQGPQEEHLATLSPIGYHVFSVRIC